MDKLLTILILTISSLTTYCQNELIDELHGFQLGQYQSVVYNELGKPDTCKILEDSTLIDFYYLDSIRLTHMAFIYLPHSDEINSIQLTGVKSALPFNGLQLGDNSERIIKSFSKPDTIIVIEFNKKMVQTWKYNNKNYSFVLVENKLNSIKIWDDYSRPNYSSNNYSLPALENYINVIKKLDKELISKLLSPNLEVFYCDKVISWKNSMYKDIFILQSSVYDFIVNPQYGLITLAKYDSIPADLNIRYIEGCGTFPVYKLQKGELIQEIVFKYQQGRYKIWEIKYECDDKN